MWRSDPVEHISGGLRVKAAKLLAVVVVVFWALFAGATQLVLQKEVFVSRALAGRVTVPGTEEPVNGATVELCTSAWKKVILSTKTDERGHFSLPEDRKAQVFYLRVSAPGMDIYEFRVRIDQHAAQELHVHLTVAT